MRGVGYIKNHGENKKQRRLYQNAEAIALIVQSFPYDLGSRNMIWKLESEIHKLSSTPKTEKKGKKKSPPITLESRRVGLFIWQSSAQVWTKTLNLVLMCFFHFFVHNLLYTGLGSDCNISLQSFFFGIQHYTKINKTISFWFSICHFGSMAVIFFLSLFAYTVHKYCTFLSKCPLVTG